MYFKVLFMDHQSPADQSLETLQDIKRIMERSSRFISLSGLSGVSAGICALIGAWIARGWIAEYYGGSNFISRVIHQHERANELKWKLIELAAAVLIAAITTATMMTWRKARKSQLPVWDHTSRRLAINMLIPLITGGFFVVGLLYRSDWEYVAPSCLIFYGLALVNASKYTLTDIRYLGLLEIALGCVCMYYPHDGLYFWAVGFGVLHIVYGLIMWWKYEKS
ncbi:MAG TPA: hypothetical protein VKR41_02440 [Puia sp.]|nr:hypothetical protein [Puia sp.]